MRPLWTALIGVLVVGCHSSATQETGDRPNAYNVVPGEPASEITGAFGQPESKSTTVVGSHRMESWHYGNVSIIVDNDKVTSVSDASR